MKKPEQRTRSLKYFIHIPQESSVVKMLFSNEFIEAKVEQRVQQQQSDIALRVATAPSLTKFNVIKTKEQEKNGN